LHNPSWQLVTHDEFCIHWIQTHCHDLNQNVSRLSGTRGWSSLHDHHAVITTTTATATATATATTTATTTALATVNDTLHGGRNNTNGGTRRRRNKKWSIHIRLIRRLVVVVVVVLLIRVEVLVAAIGILVERGNHTRSCSTRGNGSHPAAAAAADNVVVDVVVVDVVVILVVDDVEG
jgi:hypothetical protein